MLRLFVLVVAVFMLVVPAVAQDDGEEPEPTPQQETETYTIYNAPIPPCDDKAVERFSDFSDAVNLSALLTDLEDALTSDSLTKMIEYYGGFHSTATVMKILDFSIDECALNIRVVSLFNSVFYKTQIYLGATVLGGLISVMPSAEFYRKSALEDLIELNDLLEVVLETISD